MAGRWVPSMWVALFLERVLDLFAGILQVRLRLVGASAVLCVPVASHPARGLFGLPAQVLNLVAGLVFSSHDAFPFDWLELATQRTLHRGYLGGSEPKPLRR